MTNSESKLIRELSRKVDELSREVRELREAQSPPRTEAVGSWHDRKCARCGASSFGEALCRNCAYTVSQEANRVMC